MSIWNTEPIKQVDTAKLVEQLARFATYVQYRDGHKGAISFVDKMGILGQEEDYKTQIAVTVREALQLKDWKESWIGAGKIAKRVCAAVEVAQKTSNLVDWRRMDAFKKYLDSKSGAFSEETEKILYNLYCKSRNEEEIAFSNATMEFGNKYDLIAFLFFVKDDTRFLPIRSQINQTCFAKLNIDYKTDGKCNWDNYTGYISIMQKIRDVMEEVLPLQATPRLIDAHSFVWMLQDRNHFQKWVPTEEEASGIEQEAENNIAQCAETITGAGGCRESKAKVFMRSAEVIQATKTRAKGKCQYCGKDAPFLDKSENPYLEVHHIKWLSRGGEDSTDNTVALCPNCHRMIHILDRPQDTERLLGIN